MRTRRARKEHVGFFRLWKARETTYTTTITAEGAKEQFGIKRVQSAPLRRLSQILRAGGDAIDRPPALRPPSDVLKNF